MAITEHPPPGGRGSVDAMAEIRRRVHRHGEELERRLEATPHLGVLVGIVYGYLALFALVVVLTVLRS
jgi:hypothetical protein